MRFRLALDPIRSVRFAAMAHVGGVSYPSKENVDGSKMRVVSEGGLPGLAAYTIRGWK